jgi:hypothetical protein
MCSVSSGLPLPSTIKFTFRKLRVRRGDLPNVHSLWYSPADWMRHRMPIVTSFSFSYLHKQLLTRVTVGTM